MVSGGGEGAVTRVLERPGGRLLGSARKGFTLIVNSLFNGWRMEDVWLDR
jgi:hypothetical protein